MNYKCEGKIYTMVYNGQIYNADELRKDLREAGFTFERRFIKFFLIIENLARFCKGNIYE